MKRIALLLLASLSMTACNHSNQSESAPGKPADGAASQSAAASAPAEPQHRYAMYQDGDYGYETKLSEDDVREGRATKALVMARYVGQRDGAYVVLVMDDPEGHIVQRVSCQAPCEFAKAQTMVGDTVVKTETMRVTSDSVLGAVIEDAISGQLKPYGQPQAAAPRAAAPADAGRTANAAADTVPPSAPEPASGVPQGGALQQTSFDCTKARSIPEYLVCHDPDLAAADRELAPVYEQAKGAVEDQAAFAERTRKQWNFREKNCRDKECLTSWYAYQKRVLTRIAQTGDVNAQDQ